MRIARRHSERDPYRSVRLTLFGINIGALLAVWATLLIVVYSLMDHELYQVLDNQLRFTATRIIRNYDRNRSSIPLGPVILADQQESFSLWFIALEHTDWTAAFIDGNPFVDVRQMYRRALVNPTGQYETISMEGLPYRAFTTWFTRIKAPTSSASCSQKVPPTPHWGVYCARSRLLGSQLYCSPF